MSVLFVDVVRGDFLWYQVFFTNIFEVNVIELNINKLYKKLKNTCT